MKLLRITAAIAILSARTDAQCDFCSNGVSNPDFAIPDSGGQTCGSIAEFASSLEKETEDCVNILGLEFVCCSPEVTNPCSVCPDGATAGDDFTLDSDSEDSVTCGQMIEYAKMIETGTDMCAGLQGAEMVCCPSPAENPCPICSEGLTVDEGTVIPDADGITCGDLVGYALNTEEDAEMCDDFKGVESVCCPASSVEPKSKATKSSLSTSMLSSKVGKQAKSKCVQSLSLSQSFSYSMPSMSISTKSSKVGSKASRRSSGKSGKSGSHGDATGLMGSSISSKTSKCVEPSVHSPAPIVARDDTVSVLSTTNGTRP
eukprot:CAMPEP_0201924994 /NCGR_PEP_ID=MMETSP0903-20130614/13937_1 /ASSEMBLY_ACC=CAM_ASM_000552 /TAXON_ID=420261 /ORGANISM="Thalassiosira antarctica, Strain CCMP982" /LENGTH=315 /DNA_ID=CAMNT_0048462595 /DNA_START=99 /DNA_END=1046 /DNA_ORIENTATION=+